MSSANDRLWSSDGESQKTLDLVRNLQSCLVQKLEALDREFEEFSWKRDGGQHGGGVRFQARQGGFFNRASINISQVHYDDKPNRPLGSATALSAIVHPSDPRHPSLHLHVSFTKRKSEPGSWRLMGDLNPSQPSEALGSTFRTALAEFNVQGGVDAFEQGDRYFWIPSLGRHRGVSHFYLENFRSGFFLSDLELARGFAERVISTYAGFLNSFHEGQPTQEEKQRQLAYHTLYFFQVLLYDRGTTAGLLVHDQNDEGVLGSLPAKVDLDLLRNWHGTLPKSKGILLETLLKVCGPSSMVEVDPRLKLALAQAMRAHYRLHPETA